MALMLEVAQELLGMFLADARLTFATLVLVGVVAGLVLAVGVAPLIGKPFLVIPSAKRATRRMAWTLNAAKDCSRDTAFPDLTCSLLASY